MKYLGSTSAVLLALSSTFVACGGGDDPLTEAQFCQQYAKRECEKLAGFCFQPAADCERVREQACQTFAASQKSGVRQFRPGNADACLAKVSMTYSTASITPAALADLNQVCSRVFQGTAKANETCTVDYDCEAQLICTRGRCGPRRNVAPGGNCGNPGEVCSMGEYCRASDGFAVCTARKAKDATCSATEPCLETLRCDGTCADRRPSGGPCGSNDDCQTGYCSPYSRTCGSALVFGDDSNPCKAYFGTSTPDGGASADGATD